MASASSQFYVTLPSNSSMSLYPNNTLTSYTTHLVNQVNLTGKWEVALSEIHYPFTWYNIADNNKSFTFSVRGRVQTHARISQGFYSSVQEIIDAINGEMTDAAQHNIIITLDRYTGRVKIEVREGAFIYFDDYLFRMLGLKYNKVSENVEGHLPVDVNGGFYGLYVYCDIVENHLVGDVSAPLLRIVPVQKSGVTQGDVIAHTFSTPHYVPVKRKNFENIQMDIRTDTGEKVPFQHGKLTTTLHFRKSRPSLF